MDARPPAPLSTRRFALVASLLCALGFAWILRAGGLPIVPPRDAFADVAWWMVAAHVLPYAGALYLRAHRWTWLLAPIEPVPLRRVLTISFIGYGALILLPFRTGEAVRPLLIRRRGLSAWAAAGTVAAERIIDGLFLSALLFAGLALARPHEPLPDHIGDLPVPASAVPRAAWLSLCVFVAAFVVIGVFWLRRAWARRVTERVVGLVSPGLAARLADAVERVASGLGFLPQLRFTLPFLLATAAYFLLYTWAIALLARGCGLPAIDFAHAAAVVGVLHIGVLLPNAPGYFGTFQMALYAGLALYLSPADVVGRGSVLVFLAYSLQVGLCVLLGGVALVIESVGWGRGSSETPGE
jgi:hypothetical protein